MPDNHSRDETPHSLLELDLPRTPQQARSRQKRDALLATASLLFAERGYEATTADDIAAAAGVSVGTFYAYFRNKRQVFLSLYAAHYKQVVALDLSVIDFSVEPRRAIGAFLQQALHYDESFEGLRRATHELLPRDPQIASYHQRLRQAIYRQLLASARKIQSQGLTRPDIDIEATCWLITTLLPLFLQVAPGTVFEYDRWSRALIDLIYHAIFHGADAD
jgi:TetR/AcrR family transcriptional regulator, mexJK operon transcriptional repressor